MAKCPVCKQWLVGFNWTTTKNNKKWLRNSNGDWHDCPKNQNSYNSNKVTTEYNPTPNPSFIFCGKCSTLCKDEWCPKCEMYPSVIFNGNTEVDNKWFSTSSKVGTLQDTNESEIKELYRGKHESAPLNWLRMKENGSMLSGYKLTPALTGWYEKDGKSILKELYSKIWYKKRENEKQY